MSVVRRSPLLFAFLLTLLVGAGAFWATTSLAARAPQSQALPAAGEISDCDLDETAEKLVEMPGVGTFAPLSVEAAPIVAVTGKSYTSKQGLKTVPLRILSNGGRSFAEGVGETRFWLDATRPLTSAIWEKEPGQEFPAIQEMRFHFFYTVEAYPGKVFRTINPSRMRSNNVRAFPPPPGTVYRLVEPIELEDVSEPGVVVGRIVSNRVVVQPAKPRDERRKF